MSEQPVEQPKRITGYCEPLSLRAGESITLKASSLEPGPAALDLVRIICGDPTRSGPGFREVEVASDLPPSIDLGHQALIPGSWGEVALTGRSISQRARLDLHLLPTRLDVDQVVASVIGIDGVILELATVGGLLVGRTESASLPLRSEALTEGRWYHATVELDLDARTLGGIVSALPSRSPARDLVEPTSDPATTAVSAIDVDGGPVERLLLATSLDGQTFDGRVSRPAVTLDDDELSWDLSEDIPGRTIVAVGGNGPDGLLHQLPARAVTGPSWDASVQRWTDDPSHYDAVHFHSDDLYDAGWDTTASLELPTDLPSGIYAFRVRAGDEIDRVPFFVRPAVGAPTADVALLMSSCTYMAYANHRMLFEGADFVGARARLRPEHAYVRDNDEVGRSHYEKHPDGSGVMYSSRRRPVLQLRPGADGWNFTPDTDINAFLDHVGVGHDIIADEDLHDDGEAALSPYRVIVTCTHPEYWSTDMLDALEQWQRNGGRLMYLGGNGFYWRVAFSEAWPGAIELRRSEDGVRNWQTDPGESYHSFNGEYGGLWRRLGRAPNELVGIGFAAQGFEKATYYTRSDASRTSRAAWIFDGVDDDLIGTSGLGGGAAGQEIDRYDTRLGSPAHAVVLASATDFAPDMLRTKEEFEAAVVIPDPDPYVRADVVFYETPAGGAVFSVGSISWFGALARNGYDNDIATITANVVRRFAEPEAFTPPN